MYPANGNFLVYIIEALKSFVVPFAAVFFGAYFAYQYQKKTYKRQKSEEDVKNIAGVCLTIIKQLNQLSVMAMQFCDEILTGEGVIAIPFDYRSVCDLDDSNMSCIALRDAELYVKIQKANGVYDLVLNLVDRYNRCIGKNELHMFNLLGAILDKSLSVIEHDRDLISRIGLFVLNEYDVKEFIRTSSQEFDRDKIIKRMNMVIKKINQMETDLRQAADSS